jgi:hypothetical protein
MKKTMIISMAIIYIALAGCITAIILLNQRVVELEELMEPFEMMQERMERMERMGMGTMHSD